MERRYHIYKLGLAILFYMVYCGRLAVVNGLEIDDFTATSNKTDYRERRDSGDDVPFFYQAGAGTPGVDFPTLSYVPRTKFTCRDMEAGYYADIETDCQVFHICDEGRKLSFLCPNGTIFQQGELICDWWFKVNCSTSPLLYEESAEILHRASAKRKESRRNQGTRQGVFSSKEDYAYKDHKDYKIHGTPAHFVTPSYPQKVSLKAFDNRISASTESSVRRNYNIRGDRKLDSIGNGVKESTSRFSGNTNENTFDVNLRHEKLEERGKTTFGGSTPTIGSRENSFAGRKFESGFTTSVPKSGGGFRQGQSSFNRNSQQSTSNQDRFKGNLQGNVVSSDENTFDTNENSFGGSFGGKVSVKQTGESGQGSFGTNTQDKSGTQTQSSFGSGLRESSTSRNVFGSRLGEKTSTSNQNIFGQNAQEKQSQHDQTFGGIQQKSRAEQTTFGRTSYQTTSNYDRHSFSSNLQEKPENRGQFTTSRFGFTTIKPFSERKQNKFNLSPQESQFNTFESKSEIGGQQAVPGSDSGLNRDNNKFGITSQGKSDEFGQRPFETSTRGKPDAGYQNGFGSNVPAAQVTIGGISQKSDEFGKRPFETSTRGKPDAGYQNGFGSNVPVAQGTIGGISQKSNEFGQRPFETSTRGKPDAGYQNGFGSNVPVAQGTIGGISQKSDEFGQRPFETSTRGKPDAGYQNGFGSNLPVAQGTIGGISQKSNEFGQRPFETSTRGKPDAGYQNGFGTNVPVAQGTIGGISQNRFDVGTRNKPETYERTTGRFGIGYTTEAGKSAFSTSSGETQEPQETASFVKNFRNKIPESNVKQTTTNIYSNHRETYSEIKDPRFYHERPQSKLPDKPFYGSSISPEVLSTIPLSQAGAFKTTTETSSSTKGSRYNFGFKSDISTNKPPTPGEERERYTISNAGEEKSTLTTNRFGFGLRPTEQTSVVNGQANVNLYNKEPVDEIDVSINSVSSTLQPDFSTEGKSKSTAFAGTQSTSAYDSKLFGIRGRTSIETSTPSVGISTYSYSKLPTTEKVHTDSPFIKLNIIPSTALPGFETDDRAGKGFSTESSKIQIIQSHDKSSFGTSNDQNQRTTAPVHIGYKGSDCSGSYKTQTGGTSPTAATNSFGFTTAAGFTPVARFGSDSTSSTPKPIALSTVSSKYDSTDVPQTQTNRAQFIINEEDHSTTSFVNRTSVNLNINNQSHPVPTTENINVRTGSTSLNDRPGTTRVFATERDTFEVAVNDQVFTTSSPTSTQRIDVNLNDETISTPASGFLATRQNELGITATTPTPSEEGSTQNVPYTSFSSVLQPKPFSHPTSAPPVLSNSISPTESDIEYSATLSGRIGTPDVGVTVKQFGETELPIYRISSASPFSPPNQSGFGLKTPIPTLPTPFTTASTSLHRSTIDENVNNMINTLVEVVRQRINANNTDNGFGTPRPGLVVPPSAGPQTLHTLAIYFANALDNLTASSPRELAEKTDEDAETDSPIIHIDNEELIKSLLTQMTQTNYEGLFKEKEVTTTVPPLVVRTGADDDSENDLLREDTKYPTEGPPVRQLARVFTEALSAYLDDPDTFRKVLHEVRPTEPPLSTIPGETSETEEDEVLNYSDSDLKSDHSHLPIRPTGIPVSPTWGYILALNKSLSTGDSLETRNSLGSDNENLQSADSQSFVSQFNKVTKDYKTTLPVSGQDLNKNFDGVRTTPSSYVETDDTEPDKTLPQDHWTTSSDVTKLWQTTLLINPATLNENFDSTRTGAEGDTSGAQLHGVTSSEENSSESADLTTISEIQYELRSLPKLQLNSSQVHGILIDFMNATKTEGGAKLQRILHKLNISQDEFLDKMKEIEGNPLTRRLILLLISECNDKGKELENRTDSSVDGTTSPIYPLDTRYSSADINEELVGDVTEANLFKKIVHPSLDDDDEDTRALELLNSLYVIASKFGK